MKKLQLETNGVLHGSQVKDSDGHVIGVVDEVLIKEKHPLTLVKVGGTDSKPIAEDLESWRKIFEQAKYDEDFSIFTHEDVSIERFYPEGSVEVKARLEKE